MKKRHIHIVEILLLSVWPFLAACGSDSSSSSEGTLTRRESAKISVDEANRTITIFSRETQDICYYDESSESYKWQEDGYVEADTSFYSYLFRGDSLILLYAEDAEEDYSFGTVLVGGKANSLYGTWSLSNSCDYISFTDEILCDDSDDFGYATRITIGKGTITFVETGEVFDDYMNSEWMYAFYKGLSNGAFYIEPTHLHSEDSLGVMWYLQNTGIQVQSQTKNRVDFTWNDTVAVSVQIRLEEDSNERLIYTAEVQANGTNCPLSVDWMYEVGKSQCTMENAEYFVTRDEDISEDSTVIRVRRAEKHNMDEFSACLENLFGKEAPNGDSAIFYKKAAAEKVSARKERAEKLLERIRMLQ